VTVIKLVDVLQVEQDDILSLILRVVRELAVSKEILNRRPIGLGAFVGVDILRIALAIARSWIYVLTNQHRTIAFPFNIYTSQIEVTLIRV
jgi:hypothetical protein